MCIGRHLLETHCIIFTYYVDAQNWLFTLGLLYMYGTKGNAFARGIRHCQKYEQQELAQIFLTYIYIQY